MHVVRGNKVSTVAVCIYMYIGNNFLPPVVANHPWWLLPHAHAAVGSPTKLICVCMPSRRKLTTHSTTLVYFGWRTSITGCVMLLGWFLRMQKQNGPQLPMLMQLFVLCEKPCVELVSRHFCSQPRTATTYM
jgi:hypothetical protein